MEPELGLGKALEKTARLEGELSAFIAGARAVLGNRGFEETARAIFDLCREITGAASGYVALLSPSGEENEVLFLESGGLACSVNPELPMPIRGLRAEAYRHRKAVFDNDFMKSEWVRFMPRGHVVLRNVLFAPLVLEGRAVGLIGLANKPGDFTENDAKVAATFGELAAIALRNNRDLDERRRAEAEREMVIAELKKALGEVKTLSGLLPICSFCKKIRNDEGYWSRIEEYIHQHSGAQFTHGLCPDCARKHYPDFDLDQE